MFSMTARKSFMKSMARLVFRAAPTQFAFSGNTHPRAFDACMIEWLRRLFGARFRKGSTTAPLERLQGSPAPPPLPTTAAKAAPTKRGKDEEAILSGRSPVGLRTRTLDLSGADRPFTLPGDLRCFQLNLSQSAIQSLPDDVHAEFKIDLTGCAITALPPGLKTGSLILSRCLGLSALPEGLDVNFLNIEGCVALEEWPASAKVTFGSVNARGCGGLRALPPNLGPLANLDLSGCSRIESLPSGLKLSGWLDLAGTKIQGLPEALRDVRLRWRGVPINARIAFFPETLTAAEILVERNAEVRRVMIERHGLDRFIHGAGATVLDEDTDPGGKRQLLKVPMTGDEDLVCVSVSCPSTGRQYIVRVPPTTKTCRQAVAWTAGFDNPGDYNPIVET
jgi:hypothetical protein